MLRCPKEGIPLVYHTFTHLGGEKGNACLVDELTEHFGSEFSVGRRANENQGALCCLDHFNGETNAFFFRRRTTNDTLHKNGQFRLFCCDVFGQLEMGCTGAFLFRDAESFTNAGRNVIATHQLLRKLGNGAHHIDGVDNLKVSLLTLFYGLLPRNHYDRHGTQLGIGRRGYKVGCARSERTHANTRFARQPTVGGGHKASALLVAGQNQFNG